MRQMEQPKRGRKEKKRQWNKRRPNLKYLKKLLNILTVCYIYENFFLKVLLYLLNFS